MKEKNFLQEYFKIIYHLYQPKNNLSILVGLLSLICENLMECQKETLKI